MSQKPHDIFTLIKNIGHRVQLKTPVWVCTRGGSFYLTMEAKIITVEYARGKLGKRARDMTDKQIADLLATLRFLCNRTIDGVVNNEN